MDQKVSKSIIHCQIWAILGTITSINPTLNGTATGEQPTILPEQPHDKEPTGRIVKLWMIFVALLIGLWGLALFVTNSGPISAIWVWKYD